MTKWLEPWRTTCRVPNSFSVVSVMAKPTCGSVSFVPQLSLSQNIKMNLDQKNQCSFSDCALLFFLPFPQHPSSVTNTSCFKLFATRKCMQIQAQFLGKLPPLLTKWPFSWLFPQRDHAAIWKWTLHMILPFFLFNPSECKYCTDTSTTASEKGGKLNRI